MNKKKLNKSLYEKEKKLKNNKINCVNSGINQNLTEIDPLKHNSFRVSKKINNVAKSKKNFTNRKSKKKIQKIALKNNHRSNNSNELPFSIEMDNLLEETNNENNLKVNKKHIIRVNTNRNKNNRNLILNQCKTKIKSKNNIINRNFEEIELFKNISGINIIKYDIKNNIYEPKKEYNIEKIIYIQNWWRNKLIANKNEINQILSLIKIIKKVFLRKEFFIIKNKIPSISYFFHKWNNKINRIKIIHQLLSYSNKEQNKILFNKKPNSNINLKFDRKCINKSKKNSKDKYYKSNKLLNKNKKFISISTTNDISKSKEKINHCYTTKNNKNLNYINYTINNNNNLSNKESKIFSPKVNSITERYGSPINHLKKKSKIKKSPLVKDLNKINSFTIKKSKNNEKKLNKINSKGTNKKVNNVKNTKTNVPEKMIIPKIISNNINQNNNDNISKSKNENKLNCEENDHSQFNNYIININKKNNDIAQNYHYLSKGEKKGKEFNENFNLIINTNSNLTDNKAQYLNTEVNRYKINSVFKNEIKKTNSKVYENCLYKYNKYQNYCSQEKKELDNPNILNNNKYIIKNNYNMSINKNSKLNKKEKENLVSNNELLTNRNNLKFHYKTNISIENMPKNETDSAITNINSFDTISNNKNKKINNKNMTINIYFNFWKEYINKKIILQKLIKITEKKKFHKYIIKMMYKMLINILNHMSQIKRNNMKEIKIYNYNKGNGDIINNININNYIHYDDYKSFQKNKNRNPNILSKIKEFKSSNNNSQFQYFNTKLSISNSMTDKIVDINQQNNNFEELISNKINSEKDKLNNNFHNNSGYLKHKILNNFNNDKLENGIIVDQINQLKMVFNLIERYHNNKNKKNKSYTLFSCFNKWKNLSLSLRRNNITKSFDKKLNTPKINEKIINLKPFNSTKNQHNSSNNSFKKNLSLNKISPKIINVINVQNYNENNNYNYNFKCMPIKDFNLYDQNQRNTYGYNENEQLITLTNNENAINSNINNNMNLNSTTFLTRSDNKHKHPNIIYHKKKLGNTYINNNFNFNFNNNIDSISNDYYKFEKKVNYQLSPLFLDNNRSGIFIPDYNRGIYNIQNNLNKNSQTVFAEKSSNNLTFCSYEDMYPEQKYGIKKINKIEEKEVNFIGSSNIKKNIYIKKPHCDTNRTKNYIIEQNNIKTSSFKNDESENNKNLIKTLNIHFGKNNLETKSHKYITINEENKLINDKLKISLTKKNFNQKNDNNSIRNENNNKINKTMEINNKLNEKILNNKILLTNFDCEGKIIKQKLNNMNKTFIIYSGKRNDFKVDNLKVNHFSF